MAGPVVVCGRPALLSGHVTTVQHQHQQLTGSQMVKSADTGPPCTTTTPGRGSVIITARYAPRIHDRDSVGMGIRGRISVQF